MQQLLLQVVALLRVTVAVLSAPVACCWCWSPSVVPAAAAAAAAAVS
jgi:hypothetical protein